MRASNPQGRQRHWSRWLRRRVVPLIVAVTLSLVGVGVQLTAPVAAHAASSVPNGPSAVEDEFGNQYVFWRGATGHQNLYETYYNVYTKTWSNAMDLGMGPLGSEPTVVSTDQVFAGPGGKEFNAQYVYWEGQDGGIFMAYWEGGWHGPTELSNVSVCSQPGAAAVYPNKLEILIFWQGTGGYCGQDNGQGSGLYYTYSTSANPTSAAGYSAQSYQDSSAGLIGSAPSATTVIGSEGQTELADSAMVTWKGNDSALWTQTYDSLFPAWSSPAAYSQAGLIGSAPSDAGNTYNAQADSADVTWTGQDGKLWYGNVYPGVPEPVAQVPAASSPISAPTTAQAPRYTQLALPAYLNEHIFYVGPDNNLWQSVYDASTHTWGDQDLGDGPILP
jgi:hypothetical protein